MCPQNAVLKPTTSTRTDDAGSARPAENKKILSRALAQANDAVLLDNAGDIDAALSSYGKAMDLLEEVMGMAPSFRDDRKKLTAIRNTYLRRKGELLELKDQKRSKETDITERNLLVDKAFTNPVQAKADGELNSVDELAEELEKFLQ